MLEVLWGIKINQSSIQNAHMRCAVGKEGWLTFRNAVAVLAVCFCLHSHNSFAATDDNIPFNIPQQRADTALTLFAEQANLTLVFPFDQVKDITANRLVGQYPIDTAVNILLQDTGLTPMFSEQLVLNIAIESKGKRMNIHKTHRKTLLAGLVGLFAAGGSLTAVAQGDEAATGQSRIDEIIVTAQKREQTLHDVPMSITAVSSEEISRRGLVSGVDYLNSIAGVNAFEATPGSASGSQIFMRGVTTGMLDQSTVATYIGEIPLTSPLGAALTDIKLVDMQRVEVLRGPQGTLYGGGSLAGAVRNIPEPPKLDQLEGKIEVGYGVSSESDDSLNKIVGVVNLPLKNEELALRVAAYRFENAGYIDHVSTDQLETLAAIAGTQASTSEDINDSTYTGFRAGLLWTPSDDLSISMTVVDQTVEFGGGNLNAIDIAAGGYTAGGLVASPDEDNDENYTGVNLLVEYDLVGMGTITSSSVYYEGDSYETLDNASFAWAANSINNTVRDGVVQELRFSSDFSGPLQLIAGLYYEEYNYDTDFDTVWYGNQASFDTLIGAGSPDGFFSGRSETTADQSAVFGELDYSVNDYWNVTLGSRFYKYDRVDNQNRGDFNIFGAPRDATETIIEEEDASYKANVNYKHDDNSLFYLQWSQGFRLGRGQSLPSADLCDVDNDGILDTTNAALNAEISSDFSDNYELGSKFTLLENSLILNAALYRIDWTDIPVRSTESSTVCPGRNSVRNNADKARIEGVEFEVLYYATNNLQLSLAASYLESEFLTTGIGTKGDRLPMAPRYNGNLGVEYSFDIVGNESFLRADYNFMGDYDVIVNSSFPPSGDFGKLDMRAGITVDQFSFQVYGKNLTNEDAIMGQLVSNYGWRLAPRTVGLEVAYQF